MSSPAGASHLPLQALSSGLSNECFFRPLGRSPNHSLRRASLVSAASAARKLLCCAVPRCNGRRPQSHRGRTWQAVCLLPCHCDGLGSRAPEPPSSRVLRAVGVLLGRSWSDSNATSLHGASLAQDCATSLPHVCSGVQRSRDAWPPASLASAAVTYTMSLDT